MNQDRPAAVETVAPPERTPRQPSQTRGNDGPPKKHSSSRWVLIVVLILAAIGFYYFWSKKTPTAAGDSPQGPPGAAQKKGAGPIPVVTALARRGSIPVYFMTIGNVYPIYTVAVRSRVDGELMEVHYREGDIVQKGSPLIEIDSRPYDAALLQAQGALIRDQALLDNARIDLTRYKTLLAQNAIPEQQLATQEALVKQDEGIVKTDQGVIDTAKLNVTYSHIAAPISGRVGLRLVDPGNIVHAADTNAMLVITQIDPISAIFTLAEDQLPVVLQKLNAGQHLAVDAFDRQSHFLLAHGKLATVDNQIDPTTGTLRLRADFDNPSNKLFPNQFVNIRLVVQLKQGVTLVPSAVVQQNSRNTYVYLLKPDSTVTVRNITVGTVEGDDSEVVSGLNPGDQVVMTGVDKLTEGSKVAAHLGGSTNAPGSGSGLPTGAPAQGKGGKGAGHKAS